MLVENKVFSITLIFISDHSHDSFSLLFRKKNNGFWPKINKKNQNVTEPPPYLSLLTDVLCEWFLYLLITDYLFVRSRSIPYYFVQKISAINNIHSIAGERIGYTMFCIHSEIFKNFKEIIFHIRIALYLSSSTSFLISTEGLASISEACHNCFW